MTTPDTLDAIVAEALTTILEVVPVAPYYWTQPDFPAVQEAIRAAVLTDRERQAERLTVVEAAVRRAHMAFASLAYNASHHPQCVAEISLDAARTLEAEMRAALADRPTP